MFSQSVETPAVELCDLRKSFRREGGSSVPWRHGRKVVLKHAVDNVSMVVPRGEVTGIIGLNGSGKSTLIRILATLTLPDTGVARVFGHDVVSDAMEVRRLINRVSVEASFFKEMSPWENLMYSARLYGSGPEVRPQVEHILSRLGLPRKVIDKPMKHLSRGQQQKVAIARSFLGGPSLLLMDEPTTGLDPRSKREVQTFISAIRREAGTTVLISTHDLQEAEALCDRVVLLDGGRIIADGTAQELTAAHTGTLEDVFLKLTGKSFDEDTEDEDIDDAAETEIENDTWKESA
jgi:ABC-2 type transport system ATP-binding protein